jgi:ribulose-5-phosphate 4-epimerase/fuculose-1-phosphate aldolase
VRTDLLRELNQHAAAIGADARLVQGAGGNLSGKDGDLVWVKASGTRLGEALGRQVFVGVDGARARADVLRMEDLRHLVVEPAADVAARPSIETALHVLLPHRFVFHVHAVGSVAASIQRDPARAVARLAQVGPVAWVPYAKPGIALARAVMAALDGVGMAPELVLLLGNHGLVTAADSADQARTLIDQAEAALRRTGVDGQRSSGEVRTLLAPAGSVDAAGARLLTGGVLTPDEAVFLGPRPFALLDEPTGRVRVTPDGAVLVPDDLSADARDIALSLLDVAAHADPAAPTRYLGDDEIRALITWEAEEWRRGMQR